MIKQYMTKRVVISLLVLPLLLVVASSSGLVHQVWINICSMIIHNPYTCVLVILT